MIIDYNTSTILYFSYKNEINNGYRYYCINMPKISPDSYVEIVLDNKAEQEFIIHLDSNTTNNIQITDIKNISHSMYHPMGAHLFIITSKKLSSLDGTIRLFNRHTNIIVVYNIHESIPELIY
jgi:protease II